MNSKDFILECMKKIGQQQAEILQAKASTLSGTEIIEEEIYIPDFNPDKQYLNKNRGYLVRDIKGQVWKLEQPYDSKIYRDHPGSKNTEAFWGIIHTKDPNKAKPFIAPNGTLGLYSKDECCLFDGKIYKSLVDNNAFNPQEYPAGWKLIK